MSRSRLVMIIAAAAFLSSTSCLMLDIPWNMGGGYQGEFHKIVGLQPGGTVELDNARGDVEIRGWDEDEVEVTARQEGAQDFGPGTYYRWSVRPEPRVSMDSADHSVKIKTLGPEREAARPVVQYLVYVPRSVDLASVHVGVGSLIVGDLYGRLSASLGEGDLSVDNYSGSLLASLVKGSVEAEVLDLREGDEIVIGVDQGDIRLTLEANAGAKFEIETGRGRLSSDFDLGASAGATKTSGVLGDGRALIKLKTAQGNIWLKKAE
jgi:DUF4097 and DUF4098 domain-containing protein YvlB